jgi:hypothetical protein
MIHRNGTYTSYNVPSALGNNTRIEGIYGDKIVGDYLDANGNYHGFVEAIPEPSVLSIASGAVCLLGARIRRLTCR